MKVTSYINNQYWSEDEMVQYYIKNVGWVRVSLKWNPYHEWYFIDVKNQISIIRNWELIRKDRNEEDISNAEKDLYNQLKMHYKILLECDWWNIGRYINLLIKLNELNRRLSNIR